MSSSSFSYNIPIGHDQAPYTANHLDVWVAYDGGAVIILDSNVEADGVSGGVRPSGNPNCLKGAAVPDETSNAGLLVTADIIDTVPTTGASSQPSTSFISETSPNPSGVRATSETQAPGLPPIILTTVRISSSSLSSSLYPSSKSISMLAATPFVPTSTQVQPSRSSSRSLSAKPSATSTRPETQTEQFSHSPLYLVAIILGCVAGLVFLAILTGCAYRRNKIERRRRLAESAATLPWIVPIDSTENTDSVPRGEDVETGAGMHMSGTEIGIVNIGKEDMATIHAWEPRGDRDVGEPKRAERKPRAPFIDHEIPSHTLFSRSSGQDFKTTITSLDDDKRVSLGTVDPHLEMETLGGRGSTLLVTNRVPGDISLSSTQEIGILCPPEELATRTAMEYGTPRELVPMPRFLGLDGKGLSRPWVSGDASNYGSADEKPKSRIMSAQHIRDTWERQTPKLATDTSSSFKSQLGDPESSSTTSEREGWTTSIRSNFLNAFHAVAASLPITRTRDNSMEDDDDNFTPLHSRKSSKRSTSENSGFGSHIRGSTNTQLKSRISLEHQHRGDSFDSMNSVPYRSTDDDSFRSHAEIIDLHTRTHTTQSPVQGPDVIYSKLNSSSSLPPANASGNSSHLDSRNFVLTGPEPLQIKKRASTIFPFPSSNGTNRRQTSISSKMIMISRSSSSIGSLSILSRKPRPKPKPWKTTTSTNSSSAKRRLMFKDRDRRGVTLSSSSQHSSHSLASTLSLSSTSLMTIATGTEDAFERLLARDHTLRDRKRRAKRPKDLSSG